MEVFEIYGVIEKETSFTFSDGAITSLKDSSIIEAGLRHYRDGTIKTVKLDPDELEAVCPHAGMKGKLKDSEHVRSFFAGSGPPSGYTPYGSDPVGSATISSDFRASDEVMTLADTMEDVESFLVSISDGEGELQMSNKIKHLETLHFLSNTKGADMVHRDAWYEGEVLFKRRGSSEIFEGDVEFRLRCPRISDSSTREYFDTVRASLGSEIGIQPGMYRVAFVCDDWTLLAKAITDLYSKSYLSGSSCFSGRRSERVVSENVNIVFARDRDSFLPSFDPCGSAFDRVALVEKGIFLRPYADRETAFSSGLEDTGSAFSTPFGVPSPGYMGLRIEDSRSLDGSQHEAVRDAVKGRIIVAHTLGGGDYSPDGHLSTPIQFALVYDDGMLSGFAKSLTFSGDFLDMFGDGYVATLGPGAFNTQWTEKRVTIVEGTIVR